MKFTNLKRGIAGVCAATLLTGMCAVPAFAAAVNPSVTTGDLKADGTAETVINAQISGQISVTVPTQMVVAVNSKTGALEFPSDIAIKNMSNAYSVHVVSVKASADSLVSKSAFETSTKNNAAWLKVGTTSATNDLSSEFTVSDASWDIASATDENGKALALAFDGAVKNVNTFESFPLTTLTWTVAGGTYTV